MLQQPDLYPSTISFYGRRYWPKPAPSGAKNVSLDLVFTAAVCAIKARDVTLLDK